MPFMRGVAPIRRTLRYLQKGDIVLKDSVHIVSINYNTGAENHVGLRSVMFNKFVNFLSIWITFIFTDYSNS